MTELTAEQKAAARAAKPRVKIEGIIDETPVQQETAAMVAGAGALSVGQAQAPAWVAAAKVLKAELAPRAKPAEWAMFLYKCVRVGVDPVARQAYLIPFNDKEEAETKHAMVIGIDGFRAKSKDTGQYRGTTPPQWCGEDGQWRDVWVAKEPPRAARIGVIMEGFAEPVWGVALYDEFAQMKKVGVKPGTKELLFEPRAMWKKSPANQLVKCAEAQAHRKANPHTLGGVYAMEELQHLENPASTMRGKVVDEAGQAVVMDAVKDAAANANPSEADAAKEIIKRMEETGKGKDVEALRAIWREVPKKIKDQSLQAHIYEMFKVQRDNINRRTGA